MKFVNIESAKGLTAGKEVYTLNASGEYGTGKLESKIEDANGTHFKFEIPQFIDEAKPALRPIFVTDITHVCIMKSRNGEVAEAAKVKE